MRTGGQDSLARSQRYILRWVALFIVLLALVPGRAATAQPPPSPLSQVKVVVVAPLADEAGMRAELTRWTAWRLTERIAHLGVRVVPLDQAERALREMGRRPTDLISLTTSADLGRRLGADAVITGRLLRADVDGPRRVPPPVSPEEVPEGPPEAIVTLDLRLLAVDSRLVLFQAEVAGHGFGFFALWQAADLALRDFILRLSGPR